MSFRILIQTAGQKSEACDSDCDRPVAIYKGEPPQLLVSLNCCYPFQAFYLRDKHLSFRQNGPH